MKKNALIVGGTSGLGLELAKLLKRDYWVFIIGRKDPTEHDLEFIYLDLIQRNLDVELDKIFIEMPKIDLFVYTAGYYQEGLVSELSDREIDEMISVGLTSPAKIIRRILKKQKFLEGFIAVTSTSQMRPRLLEPVYTAVKAGLGMLAHSISLDPKVGKTLVVAPSGMKTPLWSNTDRNIVDLLDPGWVAKQIWDLYNGEYRYKHVLILREPPRVEVIK